MRVPTWTRTCIRIWPASTEGKKFWPRYGTSRNEAPTKPRKTITKTGRRCIASVSRSRYPPRNLSKPASKRRWNRTSGLRERGGGASSAWSRCGCNRYIAMVGTSVRDRMNDQIIANITASAIGTNRKRATPVRKNIGTNTMQMQSSDTKAGGTRKAAQGHDVEGFTERRQHHDGAEHGERDRNRDDQGRAPAAEKQQDHHACPQCCDDALIGDAGDGAADEQRLVADEPDLERIGQRILDVD